MSTEERLLWIVDRTILRGHRLLPASASSIDVIVVETLRDEDRVKDAKVDGKHNDGGYQAGPNGAKEIGDISQQPYGQEGEGDTFGGTALVVFHQLRDLAGVKE